MSSRLLLYGKESTLLATRVMLLKAIHLHAFPTVNFRILREMLRDESFELLVLCHSLSLDEREAAISAVAELQPELKSLILTAIMPLPEVSVGLELCVFDGPQTFLATVQEMLDFDAHSPTAQNVHAAP